MARRIRCVALAIFSVLVAAGPGTPATRLALTQLSLDLPGAPASILSADVDADGRKDLVVVVAFTQWGEIATSETTTMDDVEGLVEVMTVVPALVDRREVRVFLARPAGGYETEAKALPLPLSVLTLEPGPPGAPVVALTDVGVSALALSSEGELSLVPWIEDPPVLAGTGVFLPHLGLAKDVNDDGAADFLLPAKDGIAVYLARDGKGLARRPAFRLPVPGEAYRSANDLEHRYPLPAVQDLTGDGRPDLLFRDPVRRWRFARVAVNVGQGRFLAAQEIRVADGQEGSPAAVFVGDLDGDGRAELVRLEEPKEKEDRSLRETLRDASAPQGKLLFYRLGEALKPATTPYRTLAVSGYGFAETDGEVSFPGGFEDLNGDGRLDLITLTVDLSVGKLLGSLATRRLSLGLDFHLWCQAKDGSFKPVTGLDLAGKFRLNFNDLRVSQISQFAGDFDGDRRADFVQLGRGKTVTVHRGRADCSFPKTADLSLTLREEPRDITLVQVKDFDGDSRSDLLVIVPRPAPEAAVSSPVRLDLYLSGRSGGRK